MLPHLSKKFESDVDVAANKPEIATNKGSNIFGPHPSVSTKVDQEPLKVTHRKSFLTDSISSNCVVSYNVVDNSATIKLPMDFLIKSRERWTSTSIAGYFIGKNLAFSVVKEEAFKVWGNLGLKNVFEYPKGFYTFQFAAEYEKENVLADGPYLLRGKVLFVQPWMEGVRFRRDSIGSVPIWVKFYNVPLSYWTMDGLRYIAKAIGKFIALDKTTALLMPMKFARICIHLSAASIRPKFVMVPALHCGDLSMLQVRVSIEYVFVPHSCSRCQVFGHSLAKCSKMVSIVKTVSELPSSSTATVTDHVVPSPIVPSLGQLVVPGKSVHLSPSSDLDFGRSGPALTSVVVAPVLSAPKSDAEHLQNLTLAPDSVPTLSSPGPMTEPLPSAVSPNVPETTTSSLSLASLEDQSPLALCSSPSAEVDTLVTNKNQTEDQEKERKMVYCGF